MKDRHKCVLCGKAFTGHGNSPYPLSDKGRCCDECNCEVVVARLNAFGLMFVERERESEKAKEV